MAYVACSLCGAQCSRDIEGEIEVKALVKCSDCFIKEAEARRDMHLAIKEEAKVFRRKVWGCFYAIVALGTLAILFWGARHA